MIAMNIKLDGDNAWPDLREKEVIHLANDAPAIEVALLDGGLVSGRPNVATRIYLLDERTVFAETTPRLFCMAGRAIQAKYPDLFRADA